MSLPVPLTYLIPSKVICELLFDFWSGSALNRGETIIECALAMPNSYSGIIPSKITFS